MNNDNSGARHGVMRSWVIMLTSLFFISYGYISYAQQLTDPYSVTVPVSEQTSANLHADTQQGLLKLLTRLSGTEAIKEQAVVEQALQQPEVLLERYAYTQVADELKLQLYFSPAKIQRLLTEAALPQRVVLPSMVLWLIIQEGWDYDFVSAQYPPAMANLITTASEQQELSVVLPVFDWIELSRLTLEDIEQERVDKIAELSKRYDAQAIVIGALTRQAGPWQGEGLLVYQNQWLPWRVQQETQEDLVDALLATLRDQLTQPSVGASQVQIRVEQVQSSDDYQHINNYLQSLQLIDKIELVQIETDAVVYQLALNADVHVLLHQLGADSVLAPMHADANELRYRLVS